MSAALAVTLHRIPDAAVAYAGERDLKSVVWEGFAFNACFHGFEALDEPCSVGVMVLAVDVEPSHAVAHLGVRSRISWNLTCSTEMCQWSGFRFQVRCCEE